MALDKGIKFGKEKRKPYYDSRKFDSTCRNHGSCSVCESNRTIANKRREVSAAEEEIEDEYTIDDLGPNWW